MARARARARARWRIGEGMGEGVRGGGEEGGKERKGGKEGRRKGFRLTCSFLLFSGCVESAEFPFTALASSADVSLEEMRQLVCCKRLRPTIAPHWSRDEVCTKL